jgi:hypothetical protein
VNVTNPRSNLIIDLLSNARPVSTGFYDNVSRSLSSLVDDTVCMRIRTMSTWGYVLCLHGDTYYAGTVPVYNTSVGMQVMLLTLVVCQCNVYCRQCLVY